MPLERQRLQAFQPMRVFQAHPNRRNHEAPHSLRGRARHDIRGGDGCDKPRTNAGYNNSGASTTPAPTTAGTTTTPTSADTSSPNVVADTVTTGKIKTAIASDSALKDSDIIVKTEGGVVVLSGTVKSPDQIQIASNLAKGQEGVNRVETQIVVR